MVLCACNDETSWSDPSTVDSHSHLTLKLSQPVGVETIANNA